jgi:hypothetical protein
MFTGRTTRFVLGAVFKASLPVATLFFFGRYFEHSFENLIKSNATIRGADKNTLDAVIGKMEKTIEAQNAITNERFKQTDEKIKLLVERDQKRWW